MDNHIYYMQLALQEAEKAYKINEVPIGAIIVYNNKIIGRGFNTREIDNDVFGHAEINAIKEAQNYLKSWKLVDCILYTTVEPCIMCSGAIIQARIKKLVFGTIDLKGGGASSLINMFDIKGLNHKVEIISGVLQNECSEIMQKFFVKLRK